MARISSMSFYLYLDIEKDDDDKKSILEKAACCETEVKHYVGDRYEFIGKDFFDAMRFLNFIISIAEPY